MFNVDLTRLDAALISVAAALFFYQHSVPMSQVPVVLHDAFVLQTNALLHPDPDLEQLFRGAAKSLEECEERGSNPRVFKYKEYYRPNGAFVMLMTFYEGTRVLVLADQPNKAMQEDAAAPLR